MDTLILRKYFIMGSQDCNREPEEILLEAIKGGITSFQYREKGANSLEGSKKTNLGLKLRKICLDYQIPFFINDNIDLIEKLKVDGIHVGQDDMSVKFLRDKYPDLLIGLSISTKEELDKSDLNLVDYIGVGPVYLTSSKKDAKAIVGTPQIRNIRKKYPDMPIVGIGGINEDNAQNVMNAGADGVSVISAITKSKDIQKTVQHI